jgi:hypothetical protein
MIVFVIPPLKSVLPDPSDLKESCLFTLKSKYL